MPAWDTADLLKVFKEKVRLPDANEYDDEGDLCPRASIAQQNVLNAVCAIYPNAMYTAPFTLTPSLDRKTFTFGVDAFNSPIMPIGEVQIATSPRAFSGDTFVGWVEGREFIDEGGRIRIASDRSWGGTLFCRAVLTPPDITPDVPPSLNPPSARELIAIQMARNWAIDGNGDANLGDRATAEWKEKFAIAMLAWRRRFRQGGGGFDPAKWYLAAPDLGSAN